MTAFKDVIQRILARHSSRQVRGMMSSVALLDFAVAAISLFEPIYLHSLGFSLAKILLYYLAVYVLYFLILPFGGRIANNLGLHHVILYSSPFLIAYYLSLFAIRFNPLFAILAIAMYPMQKMLYWPGYHSELSRYGSEGERGTEISNVAGIGSLAAILGPAFGGAVIAVFGFPALFVIAALTILASNLPLMTLPERRTRDGFSWRGAFRRLFSPERRRRAAAFFGYGEELIALVVWPVFIFVVLKGYAATGALVSVSILISTLAILYIGKLSDLQSRHAVLRTGTIFTSASWFWRLFLATPLGVLGADAFYNVSKNMTTIPMLSLLYSRAGRGDAMKEIVFFEQALALGKICAALIGIAVVTAIPSNPFAALFAMAGAFTLLYALT